VRAAFLGLLAAGALASCATEQHIATLPEIEEQLAAEFGARPLYVARIDAKGRLEDRYDAYDLTREADVHSLERRLELRLIPREGRSLRGGTVTVLADPGASSGPVLSVVKILNRPGIEELRLRLGESTQEGAADSLYDATRDWRKPVTWVGQETGLEVRLTVGADGRVRFGLGEGDEAREFDDGEALCDEVMSIAAGSEELSVFVAIGADDDVPFLALLGLLRRLTDAGIEAVVTAG
jgi:biopolymer transport protein ExbD